MSVLSKLWPDLTWLGEHVLAGGCILVAFWTAAKLSEYFICRIRNRMPHNSELLLLLGRTTKIAVLIFGLATALGTMGVNVSALVAGLGLTGFALGFAFRDVLSNFLSGVLLLLFRPFRVADHISINDLEGEVVSIDLRYTALRQEGKMILIPNSMLFTNPILVTNKTT
jgi:small conductance mechanosensitive channel